MLAELQEVYLLRLDYAMQAVYAVQRRSASASGSGDALAEAVEAVRELDAAHLSRVNGARGEFFARLVPHERPVIAEHRAEVSAVLAEAAALVVTGGHVGVLAEVLHLFNVAAALNEYGAPVIAWSAGAMALADRIVLFGDRSPRGPGHAEVYGSGLSLLRDVVLLPHARMSSPRYWAGRPSTWVCTDGGWTCRTATRSTSPESANWPPCSPNCRSCTCSGWTTRCGRSMPCSGGPAGPAPQPSKTRWQRSASLTRRTCAGSTARSASSSSGCPRTTGR